jgi:hypothetical protein
MTDIRFLDGGSYSGESPVAGQDMMVRAKLLARLCLAQGVFGMIAKRKK